MPRTLCHISSQEIQCHLSLIGNLNFDHLVYHLGSQFSSVQSLSRVRLFETPWITAHQASLSITNQFSAKSLQSCPTLCYSVDGSPPDFPVPGILQARTLEQVAISFSNAWKWKVKVRSLSRVWLLATPWTAAHQAPPSIGFSRQEYWSGVPSRSPLHPY